MLEVLLPNAPALLARLVAPSPAWAYPVGDPLRIPLAIPKAPAAVPNAEPAEPNKLEPKPALAPLMAFDADGFTLTPETPMFCKPLELAPPPPAEVDDGATRGLS